MPGVEHPQKRRRRDRRGPDSHRPGAGLCPRGGSYLRRFPPCRLDEGSEKPRRIPAGGEDICRPGWRHHAYSEQHVTQTQPLLTFRIKYGTKDNDRVSQNGSARPSACDHWKRSSSHKQRNQATKWKAFNARLANSNPLFGVLTRPSESSVMTRRSPPSSM